VKVIAKVIEESRRKHGTVPQLSGVTEGIKYIVLADGSMEVDLPAGKTRFASVQDFQNYLAAQ
jgi:hypothetical protein